ncbi:splicing factor-like protein 1 [Rhododendron vialii]|uniref:splicing factor-like protein 1 n=1 Tax=Rhododendron vialii TaxID=182163 RepID=UPI00265F5D42|nr:splicing factor-like protein 1 [Rhododendron vialii]XP_058205868.1 splicing factor-like protein 1 [Rhododendron vialii]XP_058205869.1 splicing factor-like protein 1 [Rhododendron vialii]XP_058205870.1 splicing factor-like protein 1 [Rhododendron vialii]XP_058205871.1 splicing factor-like protein 1 [Rhododendron vialii]
MRKPKASYSSRMNSYSNFEVRAPMEEPVVEHVPESSPKSDSDDSEESEEDPEEECEEDAEEELEEDQETGSEEEDPEEESSVEPFEESAEEPAESVSPDEDALKEIILKPSSLGEIDGDDHPSGDYQSRENKRSLDVTSDLELCQVIQNKFRQEEACKAESDADKQQEDTGSSGKRRRSRWDENDGKTEEGNETSKRRKTRWASKVTDLKMLGPIQLPNFVTGLVGNNMDPKIQKLKLRLSELNSKLLSSELHDDRPEEKRSPSPEPKYNNLGIRTNTREARLREKLEGERRRVILKLVKENPIFNALPDYKPPKLFKKLYIPVKEYPTYNFIGLIIGPRGNTQKKLEKETGARILLRGKGSARGPDKNNSESDNEDLHVHIEADNQHSLDAAVEMVEKLLIPVDEGMNDHKRAQLKELAELNGSACRVCKEVGHKGYACPHQQSTFKMVITCATCGSFSHPSSSCPYSTANTKGKPDRETSDADLYVGYLPQAVDENRLRELFCPFGKISEVKVIMDRNTGLSKGYGFVKFESSIDAAMAVTHMHGLKMEGKVLAVRVAGRPSPQGGLGHLPMYPGPPAAICVNNVPSHLNHLPMYPGPIAAISANALSLRALPEPPGYMLPEAQSSFQINEGLGLPSSSLSLGSHNQLVESKGMDILPSVFLSAAGSRLTSNFDSLYRYPNQIPFSSPGLTSLFPGNRDYSGSQFLSYSSTPTLKPSPQYYFSHTPGSS